MQSPLSAFKGFARRNQNRAAEAANRKNDRANYNLHTNTPSEILNRLTGQLFPPFSHADN